MVSIQDKIQAQKDKIKKGGWKKWGAYLALAAFVLMGISVTLFKSYFLRKRLAEAKTEAAVAKEELIQDEVDDKIRDIATSNENLEAHIDEVEKNLKEISRHDKLASLSYERNKKSIKELKDWDDLKEKVKFDAGD